VSEVKRPYKHIIGHFGDESFQSIICTGTILTAEQVALFNSTTDTLI